MATIVKYTPTGNHYVLLGTGFGAYSSARPGMILGDLFPKKDTGEYTMIALAAPNGSVQWADSEKVIIVSVDGESPEKLLTPYYQKQQLNPE